MKFFGPLCSPPSPEVGEPCPIPVGSICLHCERAIVETDSGFVLPYLMEGGELSEAPYHRSCMAESLGISLTPS